MKKLLLLSAATLAIASAVHAQTDEVYVKNDIKSINKEEKSVKKEKRNDRKELRVLRGGEVSLWSKEQFRIDFEDITDVTWERTQNFDEATFTKDGRVTTAFYDATPQLVGTTTEETFADLPARARDFINKKYSDYTVGGVLFFDDNEQNETDMSLYNLQFDDVDSYFVELKRDNKEIVVQVTTDGVVSNFVRLK